MGNTTNNDFDWLSYKAEVAAKMLPVIYPLIVQQHDPRKLQSATSVAISETIDIAIELASILERKLKGN